MDEGRDGSVQRQERYVVIDEVMRHLDVAGQAPFRGRSVLAVQHVHSSLVPLVDALCAGGADHTRVTVVGKSYSTRLPAVDTLRDRGVTVVDPHRMSDPLRSYEDELDARVERTLEALRGAPGGDAPLLVVDEGAVATKVLARRPDLAGTVHVVEQTTRGARWVDSAAVRFPVVDVARSAAKAGLEAPLVAGSMVSRLTEVLPALGRSPRRAGVVGYGRMGARLAALLGRHFEVAVHDVDPGNAAAARGDGLPVCDFDRLLGDVDLLMGCTGTGILDDTRLDRAQRPVILVNGASSDLEFVLWHHRRPDAMLPASSGEPGQPWLNHYVVRLSHPHVLLAGGFPINFHGTGEPISAQDFQVTRALMLAGAVQAVNRTEPGLVPLDPTIQHVIADAFASRDAIGVLPS